MSATMWRQIANSSMMRALSRWLLPTSLRTKIAGVAVPPPDVELFRTMLSITRPSTPVPGRVVMVCGSLQPGGAERQVANCLIGLASEGTCSPMLLCDFLHGGTSEKYDFYLPLAQTSGVEVRQIRTSWGQAKVKMPRGLQKAAQALHPGLIGDVVNLYHEFCELQPEVVHSWLDWSNVRAGLAAVLAGVPRIVLSGRNLSPRHFALNTDYFYPAYRALTERNPEQIIFLNNSQAGANDYASWLGLPSERVKVIRNGVQFSEAMRPGPEHNAAFRARFGIPPDVPLVGGMFRFSPEKQPLLWLETAALVARRLPDVHFVIFGDGLMRAEIAGAARAFGIEARTRICGIIPQPLHGLSPCDLVLLTSSGEGTPNVLLEAQWLGLPVVTTNVGGAGEAVFNEVTGLVVDDGSADPIAEAVVWILLDAQFRARARREGPAFIASRYGVERMIAEMLATYHCREVPKSPALDEIACRTLSNEP